MKRVFIILLFSILMFAVIVVVLRIAYGINEENALTPQHPLLSSLEVTQEKKAFSRSDLAARQYTSGALETPASRSLDEYYRNRAFTGAPPIIPHDVASSTTIGGNACLKCHQNGGFAASLNAYAPITPHPEMRNCLQCHVEQVAGKSFSKSNWQKPAPPAVGVNQVLPGSPPVVPHGLQMRESCLSCHAGLAAPKEIRVTHPERINCRQCHIVYAADTTIITNGYIRPKTNHQ